MSRDFNRADRVAGQLQREIAQLLQTEVKDPRLGLVTVSGVEVSRDMAHAKVFFTLLDATDEHCRLAGEILNGAAGYLRHLVGQRVRIRIVPTLRFVYDESVARGATMSELIDEAVASDHSPPADD
jgi:ribosome-binding factor A